MKKLDNKVAIITGGGTGIGRAIADDFAAHGARLVIACRSKDVGERTVNDLKKLGTEAIYIKTDISKPDECKRLVKETLDNFGKIDILINNAGISTSFIPFMEMSEDQFDLVVDTNFRGTFFLSQAAAKEMAKLK